MGELLRRESWLKVKTGGRQTGSTNRITSEIRGQLSALLSSEFDKLPELLETVEPEKRIDLLFKLKPYVLGKAGNLPAHIIDKSLLNPELNREQVTIQVAKAETDLNMDR
jgi:hypothetical protein